MNPLLSNINTVHRHYSVRRVLGRGVGNVNTVGIVDVWAHKLYVSQVSHKTVSQSVSGIFAEGIFADGIFAEGIFGE